MAGLGTILAGLVSGVGEETQRQRKSQEEQQAKIQQLVMEQRLKQQFDPEVQAKQRAMALVAQLVQPAPELRLRPDAPTAGANRLKAEFAQRQGSRTQAQSELDLMQQAGLLPQRTMSPTEMLLALRGNESGASSLPTSPSPSLTPPEPTAPVTSTPSLPAGQIPVERASRAIGRLLGVRETPKALMESYAAKTATAARGLGDTANIAVEERKMMADSFPRDGESQEARNRREQSLMAFFDQKESLLQELANQPLPQILKGTSRFGPRYEVDPAAISARREAVKDLQKLRQTRLLYQQMYKEANQLMPAIGSSAPSTTTAEATKARLRAKYGR